MRRSKSGKGRHRSRAASPRAERAAQAQSNFLLWQSAYAELYFCEAYWPAFREVDFLRALRSYAQRQRRHGA
ncbi:undecaprenyl diphosphate synthase family protein [Kutzneria sp. 744]|uniref:undecaprenyl diphosphate synthase family protein n=1 Tax=Kutzneria sp. (strain 744) TaxID=345341 RepID=UPI000A00F1FD